VNEPTVVAWSEKRPPRQHWVMASYGVMEPLRLSRTCKHGCCVDQGFGPMVLPLYWRDATPEEVTRGSWLKPLPPPPSTPKQGEGE
jgi:hypothetical protein